MCTRWVSNSAAFAYKFPSEQFLGRNIAKNYMVSGIYIFNRRVLLEAYRILNGTSLFGNISEYVILGEIASSYTDLYEFLSIDTSNLEITNNLQQDVTSGLLKLSFPNLSILRELRVVVFWSRWGELPLVMHALNYLPWMELESSWSYDLVFESSLNRWRNFERVTRNVESVVNFIRKRFAYSDGYIYPEIYFEMEAGEETFVKVTNSKGSESYMYSVDINGALQLIESYSEFETLRIPANETATKYLFRFRTKVEEPDSGRRLYAQV
jgi:hypothetical protein